MPLFAPTFFTLECAGRVGTKVSSEVFTEMFVCHTLAYSRLNFTREVAANKN